MAHNPYNQNYQKFVNTPSGKLRLQLGHKGRAGSFWSFVWPTKDGQITTRFVREAKKGWTIRFFVSDAMKDLPAQLKADTYYAQVEMAATAAAAFLAKRYPPTPGGSFQEQATYARRKLEAKDPDRVAFELSKPKKPKPEPKPKLERKNAPWRF